MQCNIEVGLLQSLRKLAQLLCGEGNVWSQLSNIVNLQLITYIVMGRVIPLLFHFLALGPLGMKHFLHPSNQHHV